VETDTGFIRAAFDITDGVRKCAGGFRRSLDLPVERLAGSVDGLEVLEYLGVAQEDGAVPTIGISYFAPVGGLARQSDLTAFRVGTPKVLRGRPRLGNWGGIPVE